MFPQRFHLILSVFVTGSVSVSWDMKVSPLVSVLRGEDAVLGCSFTHPRQQDYSGTITVKWLARGSKAEPFFTCSLKNESADGLGDCAAARLRSSLKGDPRRGELSLLIRAAQLSDNGAFFCRVELDGYWSYFQKETQLYVTVKPQILSLSVVEGSSGPDGAPRRLQCEVEGHPLPSVSWLRASGGPFTEQTSGAGAYRLLSRVPYLEGDVLTCRAESPLGAAETTYPPDKSLPMALTASGLAALLLAAGLVCCRRRRAAVENQRRRRGDSPAEGGGELQLVYSALTLSGRRASVKSSTGRRQDAGEPTEVVYSAVNVQ